MLFEIIYIYKYKCKTRIIVFEMLNISILESNKICSRIIFMVIEQCFLTRNPGNKMKENMRTILLTIVSIILHVHIFTYTDNFRFSSYCLALIVMLFDHLCWLQFCLIICHYGFPLTGNFFF